MHRVPSWTLGVGGLLLALAGCNGSAAPTSPVPDTPGSPQLAPTYSFVPGGESLVAMFQVEIDPATLAATVKPLADRAGQATPPQGFSYDLDIANFLRPDSFEVTSVSFDGDGDVRLGFIHRHPFPAPNFSNPITGQNRADLSYTGRLLVLADDQTQTFFSTIRTDPSLVKDADGYINPGDLLARTGLTNNTFPYVLLADEAEDNRIGASNGSQMHGSYAAASGGWQRNNIGTGTGWTGYDYVHGGQAMSNELNLRSDALAATDYGFHVAILIKYTDPRGMGGRTLRFPPATTDVTQFAYRLPYAALDVSKVAVTTPDFEIAAGSGAFSSVSIEVRDWDSLATEAAQAFLGAETNVNLIEPGAAGEPVVVLHAPALAATPVTLNFSGGTSGEPGAEHEFTGTLLNDLGTAAEGRHWGLYRITDPSAATDESTYHFGADPHTIVPSANRAIDAITYQATPIDVLEPLTPPVITSVTPNPNAGCAGSMVAFSITYTGGAPTSWNWNFGGASSPNTSTLENPTVTLGAMGSYSGSVSAGNAAGTSAPFNFGANVTPPWVSHTVYPTSATANRGWRPMIELYDGKPFVVSLETTPLSGANTTNFVVHHTANPNPGSSSDWTSYQLHTMPDNGLWSGADVLNFNGRIAIAFNHITTPGPTSGDVPVTSELRIALANVTEPTVPAGVGDYTIHTIDGGPAGISIGRDPDLVIHDSKLAVSYWDMTPSAYDLRIAQATVALPGATGDWTKHAPDGANQVGVWTGLVSYDDGVSGPRLAGCYWDVSLLDLKVARALNLTPAAPGDWQIHAIDTAGSSNTGRWSSITQATIGGNPRLALVYNHIDSTGQIVQLKVGLANTAAPTSDADWNKFALNFMDAFTPGAWGTDIAEDADGHLVVAWDQNTFSDDLGFARANNTSPSGPGDFTVSMLDTATDTGYYPQFVNLANDNLAIVYRDGANFINTQGTMKFIERLCAF